MSANLVHNTTNKTHNIAEFKLDIPIPSYLLAIASGNLVYKSLGKRVGVITEPTFLDKCVTEISDL